MGKSRNISQVLNDQGLIEAADLAPGVGTPEQGFNFRNRIINGNMRIDQRNAGAAVTSSGSYVVDRFSVVNVTDGAFSAQQDSSAPTGFINSIKCTTTTADASLGTDQRYFVRQAIEGTNIADLGWGTANAKTVTLSFWVRSSLTGTFGGVLRNSASNRSYPFTYSISAANTWEQKSVTVAGDTSGTWLTTTGVGILVVFGLGIASNLSGTAGAWAGAEYLSATGATSVIGTLNATWYVTGVQLEVGSVATPFERRPYGTELALCQRYFAKTYDQDVVPGTVSSLGNLFTISSSAGVAQLSWCLPVEMRDNPTITVYNATTGGTGTWNDGGAVSRTVSAIGIGTRNVGFQSVTVSVNSTIGGQAIASVEL